MTLAPPDLTHYTRCVQCSCCSVLLEASTALGQKTEERPQSRDSVAEDELPSIGQYGACRMDCHMSADSWLYISEPDIRSSRTHYLAISLRSHSLASNSRRGSTTSGRQGHLVGFSLLNMERLIFECSNRRHICRQSYPCDY